ncbi:MAG: hypothetical protein NZ703_10450, partial [Gemmataceae bacterium]|nr:hypothetical protein [Gemmataceae bacterium]
VHLRQLRCQIAADIQLQLQQRLQQLQRLQDVTLELVKCDLLQRECQSALSNLDATGGDPSTDTSNAAACLELSASQHTLQTLQERVEVCQHRCQQLQEKYQSLLHACEDADHSPVDGQPLAPARGWFGRLKGWIHKTLGGLSSTSAATPATSVVTETADPASLQTLRQQLQATEAELAQAQATLAELRQQFHKTQHMAQQRQSWLLRLDELRQQRERLHAERQQLIQNLSFPADDGQTIERELAYVRRQLSNDEALVATHLPKQVARYPIILGIAAERENLLSMRAITGMMDRIVYESYETSELGVVELMTDWAPRHLVLGRLTAESSASMTADGTGQAVWRVPSLHTSLARWIAELDERPWVTEGENLVLRLVRLPAAERVQLRSEPLLDQPEVVLRFRDLSEQVTELVEVVFPRSWGLEARRLVAQQLQLYHPSPCGPHQWQQAEEPGRSAAPYPLRICWPIVEALACRHPAQWLDWGNGVHEWCVYDGHGFYTAALAFDPHHGWDLNRAQAWLTELLPEHTCQRFAQVTTAHWPLPATIAPTATPAAVGSLALSSTAEK